MYRPRPCSYPYKIGVWKWGTWHRLPTQTDGVSSNKLGFHYTMLLVQLSQVRPFDGDAAIRMNSVAVIPMAELKMCDGLRFLFCMQMHVSHPTQFNLF